MIRNSLIISLFFICLSAYAQPHPFDSENPDVHDPVMALGEDGRYYIFSTGMGIGVMSSNDMKTWQEEKSVFSVKTKFRDGKEMVFEGNAPLPTWTTDSVHGFHGHMWAPDISYHNGEWYLYYSCSTFGKNGSAIGLATNKTLDSKSPDFKWVDKGVVIVSHRNIDDFNCIDPNLASGPDGKSYLYYGSFWDGIQILPLASDLKTPLSKPQTIARRYAPFKDGVWTGSISIEGNDTIEAGENAIEAPFVIYNKGYYYLFVSWDYCCRGRNSTYKTVYGRSRSITGPYLDKEGRDMAQGGGTILVGPDDKYYGVGHCSAYEFLDPGSKSKDGKKQWYFISHAYDISQKGQSKLFIRKLKFTKDGWLKLK